MKVATAFFGQRRDGEEQVRCPNCAWALEPGLTPGISDRLGP